MLRLAGVLLLVLAASAHAQSAPEIVAGADAIRNPAKPFRTVDILTEYVAGKAHTEDEIVVYSKEDQATHQFRNLVLYVEPPRDEGKVVLLDGHVLWFYDPSSKASVRISPQQQLIGQAAIGDILTVNLAVDYTAAILGSETIQDAERQDRLCWHLDLKAANDQATYSHVEIWVEQDNSRPIKLKAYADSGRLLKILYYRGFEQRLDGVRPSEAVIIDAVDSSLVTTVKFGESRYAEIPEEWFQRDYLPRLKAE
jgi:outer membrane lipoprotein-sorting protein